MINFDDFINKWNGKGIDFDGYYGDQCMDLMHQYITEVLGIADGRTLAAPTAKDVYTDFNNVFNSNLFEKVDNSATNVPQKGDIVFWGKPYGKYLDDSGKTQYAGHVAIFLDGDASKFRSFDQNWPTGSKCHLQDHIYDGVLGWLHPKEETKTVQVEGKKFEELVDKSTKYDGFYAAGYITVDDVLKKLGDLTTENTGLKIQIKEVNESHAKTLGILQKKMEEDATAIEVGVKAEKELGIYQGRMKEIVEVLSLDPNADQKDILEAIIQLHEVDDKAVSEYEKLGKAIEQFFEKKAPQAVGFFERLFRKGGNS